MNAKKFSPIDNALESLSRVNSELSSFGMLVCINVVQVGALWIISGRWNRFFFCSVLAGAGNLFDRLGSEKVGRFYVCTTCITYFAPVITVG